MGGFSGTNWSLQGNQNKFLEYGTAISAGSSATLLTPTYVYTANTIYVRFDVGGNALSLTSIDFGYVSATQPLVQPLCTLTGTSAQLSGTICVAIPNPVPNQRIRLVITFNGSANKINFDNFFTSGVAAIGLPVNFTNLSGRTIGNSTQLTWNVTNEDQLSYYEIERSTDGRNYAFVGRLNAVGQNSYSFNDNTPSKGTIFYRIRSVDFNGSYRYSSVLKLNNGRASIVLQAFPSPVVSTLTLQHDVAPKDARIIISAQDGRIVRSIVPNTNTMQTPIDVSNLRAGVYLVRFDDGSGNIETLKFLKQ
jgi:hypothetical protein